MAQVNNKKIRCLNRLFKAGYISEKKILAISMNEILKLENITIGEMKMINELQQAVKEHKLIAFLADEEEKRDENRAENDTTNMYQESEKMLGIYDEREDF